MAHPTELSAVPLFATLPRADVAVIARHLDDMSFPSGQTLIAEGKSNHTFFVLKGGEVEVRVPGKPARRLSRGDFFGEISMDQHVPATASVVAATPVTAWVMSHTQFRAVKANDQLLLRLREAMVERLLQNR